MATYNKTTKSVAARPRNKRLRDCYGSGGSSGGSGGSSSGSGTGMVVQEGHTHGNFEELETIGVSGQTLTINGSGANVSHASTADNATHADEADSADVAYGISEALNNTLNNRYLRKDQTDSTDYALTVGGKFSANSDADIDGDLTVGADLEVDGDATFHDGATVEGTFTAKSDASVGGALSVTGASTLKNVNSASINNSGDIVTKNLKVTGSATFFELMIDQVKSAGGSAIFTPADGFSIEAIEDYGTSVYLYWRCSDGENESSNKWEVNDQALSFSFNKSTSNTYWWSLVVAVGTVVTKRAGGYIDSEHNKYHYIAISKNDKDGTIAPSVGDNVAMCGNRSNTARQGVMYIAAYDGLDSGLHAPFIAQYRGVNDYNLAIHRKSYFDRDGAKFIGDFKVVSEGSEYDLDEYISGEMNFEGRIIINGDDASAPTTDSTFIASLIAKIGDAQVTSISDLVGAIYINTQKMFWMLTCTDGVYSWTEDTDGTLAALYEEYKAQKKRIDQIVDDCCFSQDELRSLNEIELTGQNRYSRGVDLQVTYDNAAVSAAFDAFATAWDAFEEMINEITTSMPCYTSDATNTGTGARILSFTKAQFESAYQLYLTKYDEFNDALVAYTANNIGSQAAEEAVESAKTIIQNQVNTIVNNATKTQIQNWAAEYADNTFVTKSVYSADQDELSAYTQWLDSNCPEVAGGTGMWTKLSQMFVGTHTLTFDASGNISNISRAGLATESNFASLFSSKVDGSGALMAMAEFGAYLQEVTVATLPSDAVSKGTRKWWSASMDKYIYQKSGSSTYYYVKSIASISADNIEVESGSPALGNYLKINNGNLWCQNLTVEGVYNNLINVVDVKNGINADKLIDGYESGGVSYKSLDVLNLGDVVSLQSTHNGSNNNSLVLPYYIDSVYNRRTYTRYNDNSSSGHLITRSELKQLIGRRITILVEDDAYMAQKLYGVFSLDYAGDVEDALTILSNGASYMKRPTAEMGVSLAKGMVLHLEFRPVQFVSGGVSYFGYAWLYTSAPACSLDSDDAWEDE